MTSIAKDICKTLAQLPSPEDIRSVVTNTQAGVAVTVINATVFLASTFPQYDPLIVTWWALTLAFCVFIFTRSRAAAKKTVTRVSKRAAGRLVLFSALLALPWAVLALYVTGFGGVSEAHSLLALLACVGMGAGGTFMLHRALLAAITYNGVVLGGCFIAIIMAGLPETVTLSSFAVIYWVFLFFFAYSVGGTSRERDVSVRALSISVKELERAKNNNYKLANIDTVTGLPNRKAFRERLLNEIEEARANGSVFTVLMMDLDHFKNINDLFGHQVGDELLSVIGERLNNNVAPEDCVARLGGDEFAILLKDCDAWKATHIANGFIKHLSEPVRIAGQQIHPGGSIGACSFPLHATDGGEILRNSDLALNRAKELGRLRCVVFDQTLNSRIVDADKIEKGLRRAIKAGDIRMAYQPKISMETGRITSAEALVRWTDPELGPVSPDRFLPIAAERGLLSELSSLIAREVGKDVALFRETGADFGKISINVHPVELKSPQLLLKNVETLAAYGVFADHLVLEVTEGCFVGRGTERAPDILQHLAGQGYEISLDDFGTGHASLSHLRDLPVREIKIDRSFVDGVCENDHDRSIVSAIAEIARGMGIRSVAEGVETFEQCDAIQALGVDMGQGYLWSRPLFANDYATFMAAHSPARALAAESETGEDLTQTG
ncbi:MAG: EAL domain-containing protein [Pseudomonadota bacterium]